MNIIEARIVRWEASQDTWGVAVRYDNHTRATWQVGDREAAERELARLKPDAARLRPV